MALKYCINLSMLYAEHEPRMLGTHRYEAFFYGALLWIRLWDEEAVVCCPLSESYE